MATRIIPLTQEQLDSLPQALDKNARPVRFMAYRCSVDIATGELHGGNVINQVFYWDRPTSFVKSVLRYLRSNNNGVDIGAMYSQ